MYRCEATSVAGFIQQLAVAYVANGYWFYVTGEIPAQKDPRAVDAKLIERYGLDVSKWTRAREKRRGLAKVQLLRFQHFFVLIATGGAHEFFLNEPLVQNIRRKPIQCFGYSLGCYQDAREKWHPSVRIAASRYRELNRHFLSVAVHHSVDDLTAEFRSLPFEAYAPVRRQFMAIHRGVNRARKTAGKSLIPFTALRLRRVPGRPFAKPPEANAAMSKVASLFQSLPPNSCNE